MADKPSPTLRIAGRSAPPDMVPGRYLVRCIHAVLKTRGGKRLAVLTHRCEDCRYDGILLKQWLPIFEPIGAHHKFAQAYQKALGRELQVDEKVSLDVFVDKLFVVETGFRKTDGRKFAQLDPHKKKATKIFCAFMTLCHWRPQQPP